MTSPTVALTRGKNYDEAQVKEDLKSLFKLLGYDEQNPLGHLIKPGQRVFIKPNWVAHRYRASCSFQDDLYSTITHPSVIRAVAYFVDIALEGKGEIVIGDNPSIDANFAELQKAAQLEDLKKKLKTPLQILDLRPLWCDDLKNYGIKEKMVELPGDPEGGTLYNLGENSLFYGLNHHLYRGVFTDRRETIVHHKGKRQEYKVASTIMNSDVYISVPKLKTHHKVGTTLNLKGLVGTVYLKNYLIHWRMGFPGIGGDAYPSFREWFKYLFKKVKKRGGWEGNDTCWRMVGDLYSVLKEHGPAKTFTIIDGIQGGEGEGPFCPRSKWAHTLIASEDLLAADAVASRAMGFDISVIKYIDHFLKDPSGINVKSDDDRFQKDDFFDPSHSYLGFKAPKWWPNLSLPSNPTYGQDDAPRQDAVAGDQGCAL
jgi:uncharacterized protein (DUF362 family)